MLDLSLPSSGVTGLWQVPRVAPVAVLSGTPKFPPQAALPPLPLPTSLVSLACALGLSRSPGSPQGLVTSCPSDFPLFTDGQGLPWEVDQRPRTRLRSQMHPPIVFLPVQVGREETSALPSI